MGNFMDVLYSLGGSARGLKKFKKNGSPFADAYGNNMSIYRHEGEKIKNRFARRTTARLRIKFRCLAG